MLSRACAVLQQARPPPSQWSPLATVRWRGLVVRSCPSWSLRAAVVIVLDDCLEHSFCSNCFAFFALLEVLSIILGEWLSSEMAVPRSLSLIIPLTLTDCSSHHRCRHFEVLQQHSECVCPSVQSCLTLQKPLLHCQRLHLLHDTFTEISWSAHRSFTLSMVADA